MQKAKLTVFDWLMPFAYIAVGVYAQLSRIKPPKSDYDDADMVTAYIGMGLGLLFLLVLILPKPHKTSNWVMDDVTGQPREIVGRAGNVISVSSQTNAQSLWNWHQAKKKGAVLAWLLFVIMLAGQGWAALMAVPLTTSSFVVWLPIFLVAAIGHTMGGFVQGAGAVLALYYYPMTMWRRKQFRYDAPPPRGSDTPYGSPAAPGPTSVRAVGPKPATPLQDEHLR